MKTAIVYYSKHHNNTRKLLDVIKNKYNVELIDVLDSPDVNLEEYDAVGIASGIYAGSFSRKLMSYIEKNLPENKDVFLIYTYGIKMNFYTKGIKNILNDKNSNILGEFGCYGWDSFGPLKLVGGIKKSHPDYKDLEDVLNFYSEIMDKKE